MDISSLFNLEPLTTSDLILLGTAIIVWIYTRAAQRSNELQTSPLLTLSFEDTTPPGNSSNNGRIRIKNIGKGTASDIQFYPMILNQEGRGSFTYTFYVGDRVLEAGKEQELKMWVATPTGGVEASDMMWFLTRLIPDNLDTERHKRIQTETPALFVLNYKGMSGQRYHSIYRLYSVLPPTADIVMQLLHHGRGRRGILAARWYHLIKQTIPHEGNPKPVKQSSLVNLLTLIHKYLK